MDRSSLIFLFTVSLAGVAAPAFAGASPGNADRGGIHAARSAPRAAQSDHSLVREFTLVLEDSARPGHLDIDIKRGDITVTAYDGREILVRLAVPSEGAQAVGAVRGGFRYVSARPLDFEVRQSGNVIELDANDYELITNVEVLVPRRIDLKLDSYRTGTIRVEGVEGHVRARSQDNDIVLTSLSGSADVFGRNGSITASFREVKGELAFETYNGGIDLTLPADVRTTTGIRAGRGGVRSQFEITERAAELVVREDEDGSRSVAFGDDVVGDINGGGARTTIDTTNGAVILRKTDASVIHWR